MTYSSAFSQKVTFTVSSHLLQGLEKITFWLQNLYIFFKNLAILCENSFFLFRVVHAYLTNSKAIWNVKSGVDRHAKN